MRTVLQRIFFLLLLLTGSIARSQVKFSATISPGQINKNDVAELRLVVENAIDVQQILAPQLKNFIIVSGPNQETGMSMVNGDVKKYTALSYVLRPRAPGNFIIPPAIARADGKEMRSNPVSLQVSNTAGTANRGTPVNVSPFTGMDPFEDTRPANSYRDDILRKGEDPADKIKKNILVRVETDKSSCFVGEPVVATYKLYTRLKSESNLIKNPSFNGFSVIDLQKPDNVNYSIEKLNGREYNVYIIRKAQLYPLQPGTLELEPAEIENNVRFIREEYAGRNDMPGDLFRDFTDATVPAEGTEDHKLTLQSNPLSVLVKPLPEAGKPAGFKGAVGNFAVEGKVQKNNFTTDDAGLFTLIISGTGNLQLVNTPEVNWPQGTDGFEPKTTDDLFKTTVPVSGRKIIEFPFTVSIPGAYSIPPIAFSFFDPKEARYKTVTTSPVNFTVTKGTGKPVNNTAIENENRKDSFLSRFFSNRLRVVGLIAFIIICALVYWLKRENKKDRTIREAALAENFAGAAEEAREEVFTFPENPLAAAAESLEKGRGDAFYAVLNQSLKNYLSQKLRIPLEDLNKKAISEKLDSKGIPNTISLQLNALMDQIEWKLYTPHAENEQMQEIFQQANELVQLLNTYKL